MKAYLVLLALSSSVLHAAPGMIRENKVFGAMLYWQSFDEEIEAKLKKEIGKKSTENTLAWDPDCRYRSFTGVCRMPTHLEAASKRIASLGDMVRAETNGVFDPVTIHKGRRVRDFAGIGQGLFLQELKEQVKGEWFANFSGDTFVSPTHALTERGVLISHPWDERIPFARVFLKKGGWLFVSVDRKARPSASNPGKEFERVVLFGSLDMNGGRLDGWATAVVAGGKKTLDRLWSIDEYKGKWAYMVLDEGANATCSPNISCVLSRNSEKLRTVEVSL